MSAKMLSSQTFESAVMQEKGTSLVDFYADWCRSCKTVAPIVDRIADERQDVTVGKVNVEESPELATRFGIRSIPTLIVFKDGKEVDRMIGHKSKNAILSALD